MNKQLFLSITLLSLVVFQSTNAVAPVATAASKFAMPALGAAFNTAKLFVVSQAGKVSTLFKANPLPVAGVIGGTGAGTATAGVANEMSKAAAKAAADAAAKAAADAAAKAAADAAAKAAAKSTFGKVRDFVSSSASTAGTFISDHAKSLTVVAVGIGTGLVANSIYQRWAKDGDSTGTRILKGAVCFVPAAGLTALSYLGYDKLAATAGIASAFVLSQIDKFPKIARGLGYSAAAVAALFAGRALLYRARAANLTPERRKYNALKAQWDAFMVAGNQTAANSICHEMNDCQTIADAIDAKAGFTA